MRRGRILILLAFILIIGALAVYLLMRYMAPSDEPPTADGTPPVTSGEYVQIVIAAQDIARGALIPQDGVILSPFPRELVLETMASDVAQVVGRRARMDIGRGVPVMINMVTDRPGDVVDTGSDAAFAIPPGSTAIAIPMDRLSGVAYALKDGDKVDVIITMLMVDLDAEFQTILPNRTGVFLSPEDLQRYTPEVVAFMTSIPESVKGRVETESVTGSRIYVLPSEPQRPRLVTQRLVQNVTVLHVGDFPLATVEGDLIPVPAQGIGAPESEEEAPAPKVIPPDIVTLVVTPQDALALNWAIKRGADLTLTLRGPNDVTPTETISVTLQYLIDTYAISVPSRLPYGLEPRLTEPITPVLPNDPAGGGGVE